MTRPDLSLAFTYLLLLDNYGLWSLIPQLQMSGLPYISYSQLKYWNQEKAERLKPQTARFEHGRLFVPWHCDRSCLSNKKGKQWHSVACNCIQGSTSQKYSEALRYLTSNKTAVALRCAEICGSRWLYLPHTHTHTRLVLMWSWFLPTLVCSTVSPVRKATVLVSLRSLYMLEYTLHLTSFV